MPRKSSDWGTKGGSRKSCLCSWVEWAPEFQNLGAVDRDFCLCTKCDVSKPNADRVSQISRQKRPTQPFPSVLSFPDLVHLQGIVLSTPTSSLLTHPHSTPPLCTFTALCGTWWHSELQGRKSNALSFHMAHENAGSCWCLGFCLLCFSSKPENEASSQSNHFTTFPQSLW